MDSSKNRNVKASPYRWIILIVYMLLTLAVEIQWLSHAAVVRPAEEFYKGQFDPHSLINIDFIAMCYMLVFLLMSFPASYVIDTYGIKKSLTFGAVLVFGFSLSKSFFASSFDGVLISQIGLAIAQPFILNAVTAVSVRWFPLEERGMAAGFSVLAQFVGIVIAMLVTPWLIGTNPELANYGTGFERMLLIYGCVSAASALALILLIRELPEGQKKIDKRENFGKGLLQILRNRDMQIMMLLFLIGLGIFNAISAMTDSISEYSGIKDSDGLIGGLMLIGGIIGATILPILSDKYAKRKIFLVICIAGMLPGVLGLSFAGDLGLNPGSTHLLLLISSFIIGFFVMSAGPIGFQYAAEVSFPAPESASQGLLLWIGQLSGMFLVSGMSFRNNQYLGTFLVIFSFLTLLGLIGVLFLRESPMMKINSVDND